MSASNTRSFGGTADNTISHSDDQVPPVLAEEIADALDRMCRKCGKHWAFLGDDRHWCIYCLGLRIEGKAK